MEGLLRHSETIRLRLARSRYGEVSEDADRLRATHEALAGFCFAVEHSKPNSRVGTLGLQGPNSREAPNAQGDKK
jgi:hypothetical protein